MVNAWPKIAAIKQKRRHRERRQEARDSGHSPKSQDLSQAVLLMTGLIALSMTGKAMVESMSSVLLEMLGNHYWGDSHDLLNNSLRSGMPHVVKSVAPIMIAAVVMAFLVTGMQVGFHVKFDGADAQVRQAQPAAGLGPSLRRSKLVSTWHERCQAHRSGGIAWTDIRAAAARDSLAGQVPFPENFALAAGIIYELAWRMAMALLIIAAADWIYHRWKFERDIRMSKQEIKDESKNMDGDQAVKGRRRQLARKMIIQRIHRDVPKADVIVTNPTELAIALKYDPDGMGAPRGRARERDFLPRVSARSRFKTACPSSSESLSRKRSIRMSKSEAKSRRSSTRPSPKFSPTCMNSLAAECGECAKRSKEGRKDVASDTKNKSRSETLSDFSTLVTTESQSSQRPTEREKRSFTSVLCASLRTL